MNKLLSASLSYYCGKTKLAFKIIKKAYEICPDIKTFVDAFAGGGSVGLAAKLNNLQVISNDHSYYSYCYNKAIIENYNFKLNIMDVLKIYNNKLYEQVFFNENVPEEIIKVKEKIIRFVPIPIHYSFLLTASYLNNKQKIFNNEFKYYMINAMITKTFTFISPFSCPIDNLWTDVLLENYKPKYNIKNIKTILQPTIKIVQKVIERLNTAVFYNKQINQVYNMDVFEFLNYIQDNCDLNNTVVYLDPPYKTAYKKYEEMYNIFNDLLFAEKSKPSEFNKMSFLEKIINLLTYKFKYYIISYAGDEVEMLINEIKKFYNNVEVVEIPYKWSLAAVNINTHKNVFEYLIVVKK